MQNTYNLTIWQFLQNAPINDINSSSHHCATGWLLTVSPHPLLLALLFGCSLSNPRISQQPSSHQPTGPDHPKQCLHKFLTKIFGASLPVRPSQPSRVATMFWELPPLDKNSDHHAHSRSGLDIFGHHPMDKLPAKMTAILLYNNQILFLFWHIFIQLLLVEYENVSVSSSNAINCAHTHKSYPLLLG